MPRALRNSNGHGRELFPASRLARAGGGTAGRLISQPPGFMPATGNERVPIAAKFDIHALNL
jgi:hypothetical protein